MLIELRKCLAQHHRVARPVDQTSPTLALEQVIVSPKEASVALVRIVPIAGSNLSRLWRIPTKYGGDDKRVACAALIAGKCLGLTRKFGLVGHEALLCYVWVGGAQQFRKNRLHELLQHLFIAGAQPATQPLREQEISLEGIGAHESVVQGLLFHLWQDSQQPTGAVTSLPGNRAGSLPGLPVTAYCPIIFAVRQIVVCIQVIVASQAQLSQLVATFGASRCLPRRLDGR